MALAKSITTASAVTNNSFIHSSDDTGDFVICKSPDKLQSLLQSLVPGKLVDWVSDGDWSMHDLVNELLKKYCPAEVYITTYAIREFAIRQLILAQDRKSISAIYLLLDYRAKVRTPEVFQLASMNVNKIFLTSIHAKITVIKSPVGCVTIVGSANWTSNPRVEAGIISLSESRAHFYIDIINQLIDNAEIFK